MSERTLWLAVIQRALADLSLASEHPMDNGARANAENWLLRNTKDFYIVCAYAGVPSSKVRKLAQEIVDKQKDPQELYHIAQFQELHDKGFTPALLEIFYSAEFIAKYKEWLCQLKQS